MITSKLLLFVISMPLLGHSLFDETGKTCTPLKKIFALTDIVDGDLSSIVDQTQQKYLRKAGTQRWDMDKENIEEHDEFRKLLAEMNYIEEVQPSKDYYDYVIVLGALASTMKFRLEFLIELLKRDILKTKKIILLGCLRPAHKEIESAEKLSEYFNHIVSPDEEHTEYTILKELVENSELKNFDDISIEVLCASHKPEGSYTTQDILDKWLSQNPEAGEVLFISHQPYIWYQLEVALTLLPVDFNVECCGPKIRNVTTDRIILDNIAREIYQYNKRINSKKNS